MAYEGRIRSPGAKGPGIDPLSLVMGVCLAAAVLWLYWPVLVNLVDVLYTNEDYSYGLLLPLVSGYLIFLMWPELRHLPRRPTWMGLALIFISLSMYLVSLLRTGIFLARLSFLVLLVGILLLIFGRKFVWRIKFPLFLLALTIPPPSVFISKISLRLQIISSQLAAEFLQSLGYAVNRLGNIIDLGHTRLEVAAACSGLGNILTLLSLGCIFSYFYQRRLWKVTVLLAAMGPIAVLANACRLTAMAIFPALTKGFWHGFSGWLIFLVSLGFLIFLNWILNLIEAPNPQDLAAIPPPVTENNRLFEDKPPLTRYLTVALVLVLIGIGVIRHSLVFAAIPLRQGFHLFPLQLGPWQGQHLPVDPEIIKATWSDAHLNMEYQTSAGKQVSLWIAYYEKDDKGGAFKHIPRNCLTGSGWETLDKGVKEIAPGQSVDYLVMRSLGNRILVFYWQLWHGHWVTESKITQPYLIWDSLSRRRTDGAMVRLITPVSGDLQEAGELLTGFARLLLPILPEFISYHQPQNR